MSRVFGAAYASAYDLIYQTKDYTAECDLIERLFQRYGDGSIRRIMDLGCGTGNHAIPLAQRGYTVIGIDRSNEMLAHARQKAAAVFDRATFLQGDIRHLHLAQQVDAALLMFAVMSYQCGDDDLRAVLQTARGHIRANGLLIFDVWYGPAVLHQRPTRQVKTFPKPNGHMRRIASGELEMEQHCCTVDILMEDLEGDRPVSSSHEVHRLRYFFSSELQEMLQRARFRLLHLGAFPDVDQPPDETTWNALGVARAEGGGPS